MVDICGRILLSLKKEITPIIGSTQINLEDIMLSEISQSQGKKYCNAHLHKVSKIAKLLETEQPGGCQCREEREMGSCCSMCIESQSCKVSKFQRFAVQLLVGQFPVTEFVIKLSLQVFSTQIIDKRGVFPFMKQSLICFINILQFSVCKVLQTFG